MFAQTNTHTHTLSLSHSTKNGGISRHARMLLLIIIIVERKKHNGEVREINVEKYASWSFSQPSTTMR